MTIKLRSIREMIGFDLCSVYMLKGLLRHIAMITQIMIRTETNHDWEDYTLEAKSINCNAYVLDDHGYFFIQN